MNDDVFARLVAEDVKNKVSQGQKDLLRLPENWDRWQKALLALIENLNNQLDTIEAHCEAAETRYESFGQDGNKMLEESLAEYEIRRKKINRFRFHVEGRLDEVSRMISMGTDQIDEELKTVEFLRHAIQKHRFLLEAFDMDVSDIDEALYFALEGLWKFDDIEQELHDS